MDDFYLIMLTDFIFRTVAKTYLGIIQGKSGQRLNNFVFQLALKGRGFNNCCDLSTTGESWFLDRIAEFNPSLCVDVGANVGNYSQALIKSTSAVVFAFEPLPGAFEKLSRLHRQFPSRIRTFATALSNVTGTATLHFGEEDSELASLNSEVNQIDYVGKSNTSQMEVRLDKLDSYLEEMRLVSDEIDLLKIDVEGHEWEVLEGAKRTLSELRPKFVQLEFNYHQLFRGHSLMSLAALLPNYRVFQLLPKKAGVVERDAKDPLANIYSYSNYIFVRSDLSFPRSI
jgi:FkbM family methyltransferase